jgi:glucokinase
LPLAAQLRRRFGLPTFVENDTNLAALGEYRHGAGRGVDLLVGLFVGTGLGAGIVAEGRLLRGVSEAAGELGYLLPDRAALAREYPGFGALEELVAGPGIARRAAALQARDPGRPSALRAIPAPTARDVTVAAGAGDELAREVVLETLDYLALGLAAVACVLDPRRVVLGGSVGLGLAPWYGDLAARLADRVPRVPELVPSALGPDAALVGALALAERGARNAERGTGRTVTVT